MSTKLKQKHLLLFKQNLEDKVKELKQLTGVVECYIADVQQACKTAEELTHSDDTRKIKKHYQKTMHLLDQHYYNCTLLTATIEEFNENSDSSADNSPLPSVADVTTCDESDVDKSVQDQKAVTTVHVGLITVSEKSESQQKQIGLPSSTSIAQCQPDDSQLKVHNDISPINEVDKSFNCEVSTTQVKTSSGHNVLSDTVIRVHDDSTNSDNLSSIHHSFCDPLPIHVQSLPTILETKQSVLGDGELSGCKDQVKSNTNSVLERYGETYSDALLSCTEDGIDFDNVPCSSPIKLRNTQTEPAVTTSLTEPSVTTSLTESQHSKMVPPVIREVPILQPIKTEDSNLEPTVYEEINHIITNSPFLSYCAENEDLYLSDPNLTKVDQNQTLLTSVNQNIATENQIVNVNPTILLNQNNNNPFVPNHIPNRDSQSGSVSSHMTCDGTDYTMNFGYHYMNPGVVPPIPYLPAAYISTPYTSSVEGGCLSVDQKLVTNGIKTAALKEQSAESNSMLQTGSSQFSDVTDSEKSKKSTLSNEEKNAQLESSSETNDSKSSSTQPSSITQSCLRQHGAKSKKNTSGSKKSARAKLASKVNACLENSRQKLGIDVRKGIGLDSDQDSIKTDPRTTTTGSEQLNTSLEKLITEEQSDAGLIYSSAASDCDAKATIIKAQLDSSISAMNTEYLLGPEVQYFQQIENETLHVMVCELNSPWSFYVHPFSTALDELKNHIQEYISRYKSEKKLIVIKDMICLAKFRVDYNYYRARVRDFKENKVSVQFIDYGNKEEVMISDLRPLSTDLAKLPAQAVLCALSGLAPADPGRTSWTEDEINAMTLNVQNQMLLCKPVYCSQSPNFPNLVDISLMMYPNSLNTTWNSPCSNINLSVVMIKQRMGRFVPISEQLSSLNVMFKDCLPPSEDTDHEKTLVNQKNESLDEKQSTESGFASLKSPSPMLNVSRHNITAVDKKIKHESLMKDLNQSKSEIQSSYKPNIKSQDVIPKLDTSKSTISQEKSDLDPQINSRAQFMDQPTNQVGGNIQDDIINTDVQIAPNQIKQQNSAMDSGLKENDPNVRFNVLMAHINTPGDFYVHKVSIENGKNLDKLMKNINQKFFAYTKKRLEQLSRDFLPRVNDYCCAKFKDGNYYRGKVVELINKSDIKSKQKKHDVVVFYIDFGDKETVPLSQVFPLPKEFTILPPFALWCCLSDIIPQKDNDTWPTVSTVIFKELCIDNCNSDKMLSVTVASENIPPSRSEQTTPLPVYLVDVNRKEEICFNLELIRLGFAQLITKPVTSSLPPKDEVVPSNWNPMEEDFHSIRNSYKINIDDPSIATIGYKGKDEKRICRWYNTPGECWRGDRCEYLHIKKTDALTQDKHAVFVWNEDQSEILPEVDTLVVVVVSTIISPRHFYVSLPYGKTTLDYLQTQKDKPLHKEGEETLEDLQKSMNEMYRGGGLHHDLLVYGTAQAVAVQGHDGKWYRGKVIDSNPEEEKVKIFFVDFGNTSWINERKIRKLDPQYLHLPLQAIECFLEDVELPKRKTVWSYASREYFRSLVDGKTLVAQITSKSWNGGLKLNLFDTSGRKDINVAQALIEAGYACETPDEHPMNISRTSSMESVVYMPG